MCGISNVAGAAGGGPPGKMAPTNVAGAAGGAAAPTKVAGASGDAPGKVAGAAGGGSDVAAGAAAIGGGGDLATALAGLSAAIKSLADLVSKMNVSGGGGGGMSGCGGEGKVAGVQGQAATKQQFVAKAATAAPSNASGEDHAFEQRVLELINEERRKAGLGAVAYNGTLDNAAEKHASHMSLVGKMAHDGIGDGDPGERARAEGWRKAWGENVATGQTSPEQVVREWMNSPTHRKNILDPSFRNMGVAYVTAANGRSYWAQEFGA